MNRRFFLLCSALLCTGMIAFVESEDVPAEDVPVTCFCEVPANKTCVLPCNDGSNTAPWFGPNGKKIDKDEKHVIADDNSLTVSKIGEADIGKYRCENESVAICSPPHIKPLLEKSVNLVQGDKLELTCSTLGYPKAKVTWIKNWEGENLELTATDHILLGSDGKLNIMEVTFDDYGFYTCNATNEHGSVNSTTKVRVKDKLAPLWPFIGIVIEVIVLALIIIIYEKRKSKQNYDEDAKEEGNNQTNSNDHQDKETVRLRK